MNSVRNDTETMACAVCGTAFRRSGRRLHCSDACRQAAAHPGAGRAARRQGRHRLPMPQDRGRKAGAHLAEARYRGSPKSCRPPATARGTARRSGPARGPSTSRPRQRSRYWSALTVRPQLRDDQRPTGGYMPLKRACCARRWDRARVLARAVRPLGIDRLNLGPPRS